MNGQYGKCKQYEIPSKYSLELLRQSVIWARTLFSFHLLHFWYIILCLPSSTPAQLLCWCGVLLLWMRPLRVLTCGVITLFINNDKTLPQNNKRPTKNNRWNALKASFLKRQTHIYHLTPKRHIHTHIYIHKHKASADKTKTLTFGWTNRLKYSKTEKRRK